MTFKVNGATKLYHKGMTYTLGVMALNSWMAVLRYPEHYPQSPIYSTIRIDLAQSEVIIMQQ